MVDQNYGNTYRPSLRPIALLPLAAFSRLYQSELLTLVVRFRWCLMDLQAVTLV